MATRTTVEITMPQMGESVTEGTILEWRKQVGDPVEQDEALLDVSTDKVDTEVPSPAAGKLTKILVQPDETVPVGTVLGEIEMGGGNGAAPPPAEAELVDVEFPQMGDSVTEGTVLEWLKQVGDHVALEEELVEISTDKVDAQMPSPVEGTLAEILVQADETVPTGTVLCRIAAGAGAPVAPKPAEPEAPKAAPVANGDGNATPVASRMASANGIDVSSLKGTGPRGRVTKEDVEAAMQGNGAAAPAAAETKPIRGPAATLVRFMNESRSIP